MTSDIPALLAPISFEFIDMMGGDKRTCNVARVSHDKWGLESTDPILQSDVRLLRYLARHQHESPFMHTVLTTRITAPIFVARQWFKSTIGVVRNEVSRRYVDSLPVFWLPNEFHMRPDKSIKQGSGDVVTGDKAYNMQHNSIAYAEFMRNGYSDLVNEGLAPEEARMFLPQNMMTSWIETGSLLYYARVLGLRQEGTHAQKAGTQELAEKVKVVLARKKRIEYSYQLLMKYNPRTILENYVQNEAAFDALIGEQK